ncbi:MAG: sensor histidine kinase [Dehalococcoidia bacterium]|nr:sensor histidine kinase [Dehalococcoidia bacterium]
MTSSATRRVLTNVRPRRIRLRDGNFWRTQALVAFSVIVVYGFDLFFPHEGLAGGLHDIPVITVIAPVLYAALVFGLEGALLTSLWCALLIAPHSIVASGSDYEWLGDAGSLTLISIAGAFLAFRVEREREERRHAESISERLRFLNELAAVFDRPIDAPQLLQELTDRLRLNLELDLAWVRYQPVEHPAGVQLTTSGDAAAAGLDPDAVGSAAAELMARADRTWITVGDMVVVALGYEGRFMGALGAVRHSRPLDDDERGTLTAAAAQASVSLENQELQQNRREILTSYARQLTNAQEEERRRIARELHDGPTQALTGLCRGLDLVQAELKDSDSAADITRSLRVVAEEAVADLRRLARDLRPGILDDLGLLSAVEWLTEDLRERSDLQLSFSSSGQPGKLTGDQELSAFRIVQESLNNIEKHAAASNVDVSVACEPDGIRVSVHDDGSGFEPDPQTETFARDGRYGILGMQERARLSNGSLQITSEPNAGTTVTLNLPWAQQPVEV